MFPVEQPQEMAFGCVVNQPKHKEGYCTIEQVLDLAKECAVVNDMGHPITPGALPFAGFTRYNGEKWQLKIYEPAFHNVSGKPLWGCRWQFSLAAGGSDPNR